LDAGQTVLALGLEATSAPATLPHVVRILREEHLSTSFPAPRLGSPFAGIGPADVHNRDPRPLPLIRQDDWALGNGILAADPARRLVICQLLPWEFNVDGPAHLRRTHRRAAYTLTRLLANLGVAGSTPILERIQTPVGKDPAERRWLEGLYQGAPHEWDDPYRFFRW
jgi:hypothetical protein